MPEMTDDVLIEQLKMNVRGAYDLLYSQYYPVVTAYVRRHSGSQEDAEDIFHDVVLIFLQKIRQPDFVLTSSLKTYLYAVARNLWLKKLRREKRVVHMADLDEIDSREEMAAPGVDSSYKVNIWLTRITMHCRRLIKAIFYYHVSMDSLMQTMGWKNKHTAANQQYKCIQQLKREKTLDSQ